MKVYIGIVILSLLSAVAFAQTLPQNSTTSKVSYNGIVEAPGKDKQKLFNSAKKWFAAKHSEANPFVINYENETDGSITGRGSFTLPAENRKYIVQFLISIATKDGKCKYDFTDFMILYTTSGGVSSSGFGYWSSASYKEAETLEYSLETFYPIRLEKRRKPSIKWYELITPKSFETIDKEMKALESSLKQTVSAKSDW